MTIPTTGKFQLYHKIIIIPEQLHQIQDIVIE